MDLEFAEARSGGAGNAEEGDTHKAGNPAGREDVVSDSLGPDGLAAIDGFGPAFPILRYVDSESPIAFDGEDDPASGKLVETFEIGLPAELFNCW